MSKLIARVRKGEEVTIAKAGKPVARLVPVKKTKRAGRVPGAWKGKIWMAPDMDKVDKEIEKLFNESKIFPSEE